MPGSNQKWPGLVSASRLTFVALLGAAGCRALFGLEEGPAPAEAQADNWWVAQEGDCEMPRPPMPADRPQASDAESLEPFILALSHLRVGAVDEKYQLDVTAWQGIGFDLDRTCTSPQECSLDDGPGCIRGASQFSSDGSGCRDNGIGKLVVYAQNAAPGVAETNFNCELNSGGYNVVIKLSEYNGLPNDPHVRVDVYTSVGLLSECDVADPLCLCDAENVCTERLFDCSLEQDWTARRGWPGFDPKNRRWLVMPDSIAEAGSDCATSDADTGLAGSKVCDTHAFVRNGYVAAFFEKGERGEGAEFWLNGQRTVTSGFRTVLERAAMVGRLRRDGDSWTIEDGTLGGVITAEAVVTEFSDLGYCSRGVDGGSGTCFLVDFAAQLDSELDMTLSGDVGADTQCDALSLGWSFRAHETGAAETRPSATRCFRRWPVGAACGQMQEGASCPEPGDGAVPRCTVEP